MKVRITIILVAAALLMAVSMGVAVSKAMVLSGKVVAVSGDKVTVQIDKRGAPSIPVGASVEMEIKADGKAAPPAAEQMQGC